MLSGFIEFASLSKFGLVFVLKLVFVDLDNICILINNEIDNFKKQSIYHPLTGNIQYKVYDFQLLIVPIMLLICVKYFNVGTLYDST